MLALYKNGITSVILRVKILDNTAAYPKGLAGLTFSSSGLIISTIANNEATATAYTAAGSTIETITTLGTFAAPTATKCRFKEVDATNHPGLYEIQIADARWAVSNARSVVASVSGVTTMVGVDALIQLTNTGLEIDVNAAKLGGTSQTGRDVGASVLLSNGTGTGQLKLASGYVAMTWADIAAPTTAVDLSGTTISTAQKVDVETIKTNPVVNGGTITFPTGATLASTTNITAATVDVTKLNGDATAAANIAKATRSNARGTVGAASTTTSIVTSAFAPTGIDADQFKGRIITFDADTTTTGLRGQATAITASSAAATPVLTVTALTQAPVSGDTFSIT